MFTFLVSAASCASGWFVFIFCQQRFQLGWIEYSLVVIAATALAFAFFIIVAFIILEIKMRIQLPFTQKDLLDTLAAQWAINYYWMGIPDPVRRWHHYWKYRRLVTSYYQNPYSDLITIVDGYFAKTKRYYDPSNEHPMWKLRRKNIEEAINFWGEVDT